MFIKIDPVFKIYFISLALVILFLGCNTTPSKVLTNPNDFPFLEITIAELQTGYKQGKWTVEEVASAYLDRIHQIDFSGPKLNAVIQLNPDALAIARKLDSLQQNNQPLGALHGIPVLLKDNIDTHDKMPTTAGSRALADSNPLEDSFLVKQLRSAGALIMGKANLSEWANFRGQNSSSGWSGLGGQTKNPYILSRNPCGSSSGSGAAVAANLTVLAIGTETNGSIVCPSHANGIVGIKPTVGAISRTGIIPISYTQDTAGPMARTLTDAVIALGVMTGLDPKDQKTLSSEGKIKKDYTQHLQKNGIAGKKIGLYKAPLGQIDAVDRLLYQAIETLKEKGATIVEIDQIAPPETAKASFEVMLYEYKSGLNQYFASLGPNAPIKSLEELIAFNENDSIELKYFNQAYLKMAQSKGDLNDEAYQSALATLQLSSREKGIDRVMDRYGLDAIVAPTGSPAWTTDWHNGDNYSISSSSPAAWAGYPNITLPMGNIHGLPVGLSFFGRAWSEGQLIEIAYGFEHSTKSRFIPKFLNQDQP